jgi:hypothetical protein
MIKHWFNFDLSRRFIVFHCYWMKRESKIAEAYSSKTGFALKQQKFPLWHLHKIPLKFVLIKSSWSSFSSSTFKIINASSNPLLIENWTNQEYWRIKGPRDYASVFNRRQTHGDWSCFVAACHCFVFCCCLDNTLLRISPSQIFWESCLFLMFFFGKYEVTMWFYWEVWRWKSVEQMSRVGISCHCFNHW